MTKRATVLLAAIGAAALALTLAIVFPAGASAAPTVPNEAQFGIDGACAFHIEGETDGRIKFKFLPDGTVVQNFPGAHVTLTNIENQAQVTYVLTGAVRQRELPNGDVSFVATGRTLQFGDFGMFVTVGRFAFSREDGVFTRPTGEGRLIDVCEQLS